MVRLKDIAARSGYSVMTVSKALRNAPDIAAETKIRIKHLAQQMGYTPDSTAQGLRNRTTKLLGLILPAVTNPLYGRTITAIEEGAYELGYDLILSHSLNQPEREDHCIRRMLSRRVDGLFIIPVYRMAPETPAYQELWKRQIPTVIVGQRPVCAAQFCNVETDDVAGGIMATRHLLELGHKRIAFLAGLGAAPWSLQRLEGHRKALRDQGIEPDDRLVFAAGATMEEGEKAAVQLINESADVTAVLAANDLVAMGAANVFLNQGMRIPQDLSVAGFGNILMSQNFRVPLTTVRQAKHQLGVAAIDAFQKIKRGERPETKRLPPEIIVRASTGAPRAQM